MLLFKTSIMLLQWEFQENLLYEMKLLFTEKVEIKKRKKSNQIKGKPPLAVEGIIPTLRFKTR